MRRSEGLYRLYRFNYSIMGWFYMYLSWILISAVIVSCQELTILPQDDNACARNKVTFSCTVRGSRNLTSLILAWSSNEYIGEGTVLRFLSIDMPETNKTSMINENVAAILTNNTLIDGVPELVSVLCVVGANQSSMITCESATNGSSESMRFESSAFPGRPQNGEARERSAGSCDFLVTWSPPTDTDRFDIESYIIYVPSRNIMNVSFSTTIDLTIPNCRVGNNSIQVAAVNRLGCVGPNSSLIEPNLEMPSSTQEDDNIMLSRTDMIAIACVFSVIIVIMFLAMVIGIPLCVICCPKGKYAEQKRFEFDLKYLYEALKTDSTTSMQDVLQDLLKLVKDLPSSNIQKALKNVLGSEKPAPSGLRIVLGRLKKRIPDVMSDIETQIKGAGSSITMDYLIDEAQKRNHKKLFEELKEKVGEAPPEVAKNLLWTLFEALKGSISEQAESELQGSINEQAENELQLQAIFSTLEKEYINSKLSPTKIKAILLDTIKNLRKDTSDSDDVLFDTSVSRGGGVDTTRESRL